MARVQFKGRLEDATSGGGGGNKFPAAPRGIYTVAIADYEAGKSSETAKNPNTLQYNFTCEIADGEYLGTRMWHRVTFIPRGDGEKAKPGHGIAVHFLHSIGIESSGDDFDFDDSEFQGRSFRALVEVEPYDKVGDQGQVYHNERNVIRSIYSKTNPEPKELPPPPAAKAPAPKSGQARTSQPPTGNGRAKTAVPAGDVDSDLGW